MNIRVKLIGSGTDNDPYRAPIPTYRLRHANHTQGWAILSVPEEVHGLSQKELNQEESQDTSDGPFYPKLSDAALAKILARWDEQYPKTKGIHRIEHV